MNLLNNAASESNPKSKPTPLSEKEAQKWHRATQETCIIRMLKFPAFQVHGLFEKQDVSNSQLGWQWLWSDGLRGILVKLHHLIWTALWLLVPDSEG